MAIVSARVLVFPPVSNFRRFLIHKVVEDSFGNLKTFSVGENDARRTVVCFQADYQPKAAPENQQPPKRPRTMPSLGIYRPPAARKLEKNGPDSSFHTSQPTIEATTVYENQVQINISSEPLDKDVPNDIHVIRHNANKKERQRRPDMAVYVPRGQRIAQDHQRKLESTTKPQAGLELRLENSIFEHLDLKNTELPIQVDHDSALNDNQDKKNDDETCHMSNDVESKNAKNDLQSEENSNCSLFSNSISDHETNDGREVGHKSEKIVNGNIENELSSNVGKETNNIIEGEIEIKQNQKVESGINIGNAKSGDCDLDWDVLYDDSGECLDPALMTHLTHAVGQVTIERPRSSYQDYSHKSLQEEFPHVVEIYNFPPEFKTPDLVMIFSEFKNLGFEIKWVDDTHALGVFSNAAVVAEVLRLQHPLLKTRCLSEGSQQSKSKARRCADSLTPYMTRPDTCAALARRLVTGALGVKLPTQRAEREAERRILQQARDKKRLAAKQREEAWEGNFS